MPLRSFRFYLSGYQHYYGHIRLPRQRLFNRPVRVSQVHALPSTCTQQNITPSSPVGLAVENFRRDDRFQQLREIDHCYGCVTKPDFCSLHVSLMRALMLSFPPALSQWLQPERQIGLFVTFIQIGIY
jgi:hypothetical protein